MGECSIIAGANIMAGQLLKKWRNRGRISPCRNKNDVFFSIALCDAKKGRRCTMPTLPCRVMVKTVPGFVVGGLVKIGAGGRLEPAVIGKTTDKKILKQILGHVEYMDTKSKTSIIAFYLGG
jgi:hypothetical protein